MELDEIDKAGLIRESYRIEGIDAAQCRSIFLDWALSLPAGQDQHAAIRTLLRAYGGDAAHPMTAILTAALDQPPPARRRGGRAARRQAG